MLVLETRTIPAVWPCSETYLPNAVHGCIVYDWELTAKDVHRRTLASQSIRASQTFSTLIFSIANDAEAEEMIVVDEEFGRRYFCTSKRNFDLVLETARDRKSSRGNRYMFFGAVLCVLGAFYGGVHYLAIVSGVLFPTMSEKILLEAACFVVLGGSGIINVGMYRLFSLRRLCFNWLFLSLVCPLAHIVPSERREKNINALGDIFTKILVVHIFSIPAAISTIYCAACIYIVIEAFISIRHVPIGVYTTPVWTKYLPHL